MQRRQWLWAALVASAVLVLAASNVQAQSTVMKDPTAGTPAVKSIEFISFAPEGVLLIGDGKGRQIVAVDTGDTTPVKWTKTEVPNIKDALAGRLGATAKDIEILKVAVNPASHTAYFAVRHLGTKQDLVLTVDGTGKVKEFGLENVKHIAVPLPADQNVTSVTGVTWAGDRILVTALAKETFANKCFSIIGSSGWRRTVRLLHHGDLPRRSWQMGNCCSDPHHDALRRKRQTLPGRCISVHAHRQVQS